MNTYREYMEKHLTENIGWCAPFVDESGSYAAVVCEGKIISIRTPDGDRNDPDAETIRKFAKTVNTEYDFYKGWDDTHIALEAMREVGCAYCPWNYYCEAMDEPVSGECEDE